jgi:sugar lactone lactonase YvrE
MTPLKATLAIAAHDKLGEGPVWDQAGERLLWADHVGEVIHEARCGAKGEWKESRRWTLHRHLAATIPRKQGGLVVVSASEVVMMDDSGATTPFVSFDFDPRAVRFNDAKCDPQGRLWAGTLGLDFTPCGALYRIDPDGTIETVLEGVTLSNGLDWSPDGSTFYYVDTLSMGIDAFDFDSAKGSIHNRRTIVKLEPGAGGANGITVDGDGGIWLALTGGGEVRRYLPDGTLTTRIQISVPGATSCAFGGRDLDQLLITSRSGRMPDVAAKLGVRPDMMEGMGPEAGGLFVCRPGQTGTPATVFAG